MRLVAAAVIALAPQFCFGISISLQPSVPSPAPLGTWTTWVAETADSGDTTLWYRFRTRALDEEFRVVRDYSPVNSLVWTAIEHEGIYEVEVSVRSLTSGEVATTSAIYEMTPQ